MRLRHFLMAATAVITVAATLSAQRFRQRDATEVLDAIPYDGRFTFARVKFDVGDGGFGGGWGDLKWNHDYPRAERNFTRILHEVSLMDVHMQGSNVLTLDDPEIFRHPVLYLCEPGFWWPSDEEVARLREYVLKGGFVIFDDFIGPRHWVNFEEQIRRVFPENRLIRLTDTSHPVFDSFFRIESLDFRDPNRGIPSEFWGMFEDNDPSGRLLFIANYNNDIGDYWEWSDQGFLPIELSNEAYKLGVNYVIYAMTH
jgi:hypothetical protein